MKVHSVLAILVCVLTIYVGSYFCLSIELGRYGPEWKGSIWEAPMYGWQLRELRHDNVWYARRNLTLVYMYSPLLLLDRAFWHPTLDNAPPK